MKKSLLLVTLAIVFGGTGLVHAKMRDQVLCETSRDIYYTFLEYLNHKHSIQGKSVSPEGMCYYVGRTVQSGNVIDSYINYRADRNKLGSLRLLVGNVIFQIRKMDHKCLGELSQQDLELIDAQLEELSGYKKSNDQLILKSCVDK